MIRRFFRQPRAVLSRQVLWRNERLLNAGVDQTHLAIADAPTDKVPFSFSIIGDTDAGSFEQSDQPSTAANFSQRFAQQLTAHLGDSRFLLHTGDVTYPKGSFNNYFRGFLSPYKALLSRPVAQGYTAQDIVFNRPLLPVPGNHDYADIPLLNRLWQKIQQIGSCALRKTTGIELGNLGGEGGLAYGQTFLDDLASIPTEQLSAHLTAHYSAIKHDAIKQSSRAQRLSNISPDLSPLKYCLNYRPGKFTCLPNRYYSFRYSGIDFFALDSNTWRRSSDSEDFDHEQLAWLESALIRSWRDPDSLGRIIYLHHSPYTTEVVRAHQPETMKVREHLRRVFDQVALILALDDANKVEPAGKWRSAQASDLAQPAVVDLVISGHAHCLEHLQTTNTGHCDNQTHWLVCGGSGQGLRAQRRDEKTILENVSIENRLQPTVVAHSNLYAGIHGQGQTKQKLHSFVRIDVTPTGPALLTINPFIVTSSDGVWQTRPLAPIAIAKATGSVRRKTLAA